MIVSALFRLEKQTVWNAWRAFSITDTLIAITEKPNQPQHWLTSHVASRALDCTDVHQKLWLTVSERNKMVMLTHGL